MKKVGAEKRRVSATGRFLLSLPKAEGTVSAVREAISRKAREMAHAQLFRSMSKKQTRIILRR